MAFSFRLPSVLDTTFPLHVPTAPATATQQSQRRPYTLFGLVCGMPNPWAAAAAVGEGELHDGMTSRPRRALGHLASAINARQMRSD